MQFKLLSLTGQIYSTYDAFLAVAIFVLQIIVVVSVLAGNGSTGHKWFWTIVVLLLPVIGLILYMLFGRSPRDRTLLD
jgi:cardiolipin synthase